MKKGILLLMLFMSTLAFSQELNDRNLKELSVSELQAMKKKAIANEEYGLAEKIKIELSSRKTVDQIKKELEAELAKAVKAEEYDKAAILKSKLQKVTELEKIEKEIKVAIANEEYGKAKELKDQKNKLLEEISGNPAGVESNGVGAINTYSNNGESVVLVFKKVEKGIGTDIIIDGTYVGTFNMDYEIVLKDVSAGTHTITMYYAYKPNNEKFASTTSETFEAGKTYVFEQVASGNDLNTMMIGNKLNYKQGLEKLRAYKVYTTSEMYSNAMSIKNLEFETKNPVEASFSYSGVTFPVNAYTTKFPSTATIKLKVYYGLLWTYPILEGNGLIAGWGFDFGASYYEDHPTVLMTNQLSTYSGSLSGLVGYQVEPTPKVSLMTTIKAGPAFSSSDFNGTKNSGFGFGGTFNIGALFFTKETQNFGLLTELNIGLSGGVGFTLGLMGGHLKRAKYRNILYN